jgi:hypothetical protein
LFSCFILLLLLATAQTASATPPIVTITSPTTGLTNDNTPLLTFTVDDPAAVVTVKVDGSVVSKVSGNSLDTLTDGQHAVRVDATNAEGTGSAEVSFTVDTTLSDRGHESLRRLFPYSDRQIRRKSLDVGRE